MKMGVVVPAVVAEPIRYSLHACVSFYFNKGLIKQFLRDVDWGERVDYLLVDTPPGTSDEHLSIVQYLGSTHVDGAVVITTPQVLATPESCLYTTVI